MPEVRAWSQTRRGAPPAERPFRFYSTFGESSGRGIFRRYALAKIVEGALQALFQIHFGFPLQNAFCLGDIRATLLGVILRQFAEDDRSVSAHEFPNPLRKLEDRDLVRIADVRRHMLV